MTKRGGNKRKRSVPEMDPRWRERIPDDYSAVQYFPDISAKYLSLTLQEGVVSTVLKAEIPPGVKLRSAVIWGNKRVDLYDSWDRKIIPSSYWIETTRKRNSNSEKLKFINIVPGSEDYVTVSFDHIFDAFDSVVAIDTNTYINKKINGEELSVLGISTASKLKISFPQAVNIRAGYAVEFRDLQDPKEKYGWIVALRALYDQRIVEYGKKIAVIVDAYANEIMDINNGKEIIEGVVLPKGVKLIYASSDTSQFFALNKCIKMADSFANSIGNKIIKTTELHKIASNAINYPFKAIRFWEILEDGSRLTAVSCAPADYNPIASGGAVNGDK
ncbi:hypothetical protein FBZ92_12699 [Nitrospirillum viridazoti]|uniref:Uncharacterized protein n=1 Tax=Nitrospirillum amazonense TaxID=28077 RepID=A0A560HVK9_9PROT|nr:hypothetical protein FBZ92_12699 [Nitrospirillum amazonense]